MSAPSHIARSQHVYQAQAVGAFPWSEHPSKKKVDKIKITISPLLEIVRHQEGLRVKLAGAPCAEFNKESVSTKYSQGPFIDRFCYSIKPLTEGVICIGDSLGGTPVKEMVISNQRSFSIGIGVSGSMGGQSTTLLGNGQGSFQFSFGKQESQQYADHEFRQKQTGDGTRKTVTFNMTKALKGSTYVSYNPKNIGTLRNSMFDTRLGFGFVPIYGWFGGFCHFPDTTYTPPECATTSLGGTWFVDFDLKGNDRFEFEWTTEVRTIFASNSDYTPYASSFHSTLSWIKTVHQICQKVTVLVDQNEPYIQMSSESQEKVICATGFERETRTVKLIEHKKGKQELINENIRNACAPNINEIVASSVRKISKAMFDMGQGILFPEKLEKQKEEAEETFLIFA